MLNNLIIRFMHFKNQLSLNNSNKGIGTIEIVLLLLVIVAIIIIFRDNITDLINKVFGKITTKINRI